MMSRSRHRRINASLSATSTSPRIRPLTVVSASAALLRRALDLTAGLMTTRPRGRGGDDCVRSGYTRQAAIGSTYRRVKCVRTAVLLRPRRAPSNAVLRIEVRGIRRWRTTSVGKERGRRGCALWYRRCAGS
jgi:hypothetical protein